MHIILRSNCCISISIYNYVDNGVRVLISMGILEDIEQYEKDAKVIEERFNKIVSGRNWLLSPKP